MTLPKPTMKVGRDDHEDRRAARADRLADRAAKHRAAAAARHETVDNLTRVMAGQPVLVGHHSEKRHRRDLQRVGDNMRAALDHAREAERLERVAAHPSTAVSGDDPQAVAKLRAKLAAMEAHRKAIKADNKAARKGDSATVARLAETYPQPWHDVRRGHPSYMLQNLGSNIRRVQKRLAAMEAIAGREARELTMGNWTATENPDSNRVELHGPRPTEAQKADIKGSGWRWSRRAMAWQRQATDAAWICAVRLLESWGDTDSDVTPTRGKGTQ